MKKKNVLGHDPLGWMKVEREKKSPSPETVKDENKTVVENNQQKTQDSVKQQSFPLPKDDKNDNETGISKDNQTERVFNVITGSNETPPKPKVVIGRLYEEVSKKAASATQQNNVATPPPGTTNSAQKTTEQSFPQYETIKTDMGMQSRGKKLPGTETRAQFSTYLIVAYTVLLLILGYFVYTDFSKRTNRLEAKIYAIERALLLR
ncbi:MAG: hypothetical protein E3K37_06300 [Candidatus Kuenenia sp.]|nr:hypothetical protein [Candidatus Kuenenia hertensis]